MSGIKVSVIIPTYNGEKKISGVLNSLLRQTFTAFEVIVVIDGSTDNTLEVVQSFAPLLPRLKIIVQSNQGRAKVRNRGVKEAAGEIMIFYDDDMIPEVDSVARHVEFHQKSSGLLCGNQFEIPLPTKTDIQNYKAFLSIAWTEKYGNGVTQIGFSNLFFTAANASIKRYLFNLLGGFNEKLTDAEDHDLANRALSKNIPVFFDKENKAIHNDSITCKSYIKRLRFYAIAHEQLKKCHPERYPPREKKHFAKRLIYRMFAKAFLVGLIDRHFFIWLPKAIRYKLYDVVIQAMAIEYPQVSL